MYLIGTQVSDTFVEETRFESFTDAVNWIQAEMLGWYDYYFPLCGTLEIYSIREE